MAQQSKQRINYVLPLASESVGHRLGVNGLAVDKDQQYLYSAGRDGVICVWDFCEYDRDLDMRNGSFLHISRHSSIASGRTITPKTTHRHHVQAHTHWINDIVLAQDNRALVSASSDTSVKVWRPYSSDRIPPQTVGLHGDYVKCLASPSLRSPWVAAGSLDRTVRLWDLSGAGEYLAIHTADEGYAEKGSVYAMAAKNSLLATGGPESTVKMWDPKSGKRVTQFIGHTDNIRSILISDDCSSILTASSDRSIKLWSLRAGRCLYNLAVHDDSVWSLYSDHPDLTLFYSGDRSGVVAKTDMSHGDQDVDQGLSIALCQEQNGITRIAAADDDILVSTASSSINRWEDADMQDGVKIPDAVKSHRWSVASRNRFSLSSQSNDKSITSSTTAVNPGDQLPLNCVLRMPGFPRLPSMIRKERERHSVNQASQHRKSSVSMAADDIGQFAPLRSLAHETIEGQHGLIKHHLLNDRRRVLTLDSAGEVLLWDLLRCVPVRRFGKAYIHDVAKNLNTTESVPQWCSIDTRTGALTCTLDKDHCFDAEVYADELEEADQQSFKEDQRINIGKWVLRCLFSRLVDEEIRRDEEYRRQLAASRLEYTTKAVSSERPTRMNLFETDMQSWQSTADPSTISTPRPSTTNLRGLMTPGLSIGVVSPGIGSASPADRHASPIGRDAQASNQVSLPPDGGHKQPEGQLDYFSSHLQGQPPTDERPTSQPEDGTYPPPEAPADESSNSTLTSSDAEKLDHQVKEATSLGARLKNTFTQKPKTVPKTPPQPTAPEPSDPTADPTSTDQTNNTTTTSSENASSNPTNDPNHNTTSFLSVIHRIHDVYAADAAQTGHPPKSLITPALPSEAPVLKQPPNTLVVIQEQPNDSVAVADLFECNIADLARSVEAVERTAPAWLGELLLQNQTPALDIVKLPFLVKPYRGELPNVTQNDGNERLNANRMLRAKKVLAYVAERLERPSSSSTSSSTSSSSHRGDDEPTKGGEDTLKPEDYLELYCNDQLISHNMTLATIRTFVWRSSGDVVLCYRSNGRRKFANPLVEGARA